MTDEKSYIDNLIMRNVKYCYLIGHMTGALDSFIHDNRFSDEAILPLRELLQYAMEFMGKEFYQAVDIKLGSKSDGH